VPRTPDLASAAARSKDSFAREYHLLCVATSTLRRSPALFEDFLAEVCARQPDPRGIPRPYPRIFAHSAFCIPPSSFAPVWLWWSLGGALREPWGGSLVPSRWLCGGLGVALRWLCIPESMPSICLVYGSEVAFRIQVDQVNLAAPYRHQTRSKPSASAESNSS
jgi:hypothetical protein